MQSFSGEMVNTNKSSKIPKKFERNDRNSVWIRSELKNYEDLKCPQNEFVEAPSSGSPEPTSLP